MPTATQARHPVEPGYVQTIKDWLDNWGGLLIWLSQNMSDPGRTWPGPAKDKDGNPSPPPTWQCAGSQPIRHITSPDEIEVVTYKEVKRFHVAVRLGKQGMTYKVTDGGTNRLRKEVSKAGAGAFYVFDGGDYNNAVIMAPDRTLSLTDYLAQEQQV